jgi:hypothetical protein
MLLVFADPALAVTHGGEGLYGHTDDAEITNTMFFLIAFFPTVIVILSLAQGWLDRRKHRQVVAEKAAREANPVKGGW